MDDNSALQQMAARGDAISIEIMHTLPLGAALESVAEAVIRESRRNIFSL
jgi:hypothetical protein